MKKVYCWAPEERKEECGRLQKESSKLKDIKIVPNYEKVIEKRLYEANRKLENFNNDEHYNEGLWELEKEVFESLLEEMKAANVEFTSDHMHEITPNTSSSTKEVQDIYERFMPFLNKYEKIMMKINELDEELTSVIENSTVDGMLGETHEHAVECEKDLQLIKDDMSVYSNLVEELGHLYNLISELRATYKK